MKNKTLNNLVYSKLKLSSLKNKGIHNNLKKAATNLLIKANNIKTQKKFSHLLSMLVNLLASSLAYRSL